MDSATEVSRSASARPMVACVTGTVTSRNTGTGRVYSPWRRSESHEAWPRFVTLRRHEAVGEGVTRIVD